MVGSEQRGSYQSKVCPGSHRQAGSMQRSMGGEVNLNSLENWDFSFQVIHLTEIFPKFGPFFQVPGPCPDSPESFQLKFEGLLS